ncbi:hypothetical protein BGZ49_008156 [Haplosporangium sp. Z 27]|nr:hypothetical protein BGZ49_008156 [Haplosporangium sp. Z 27]
MALPLLIEIENNPPSESVNASVAGFVMLMFIVARVLTTRGFAALKPGFNTRAIVTWLACTSLTLLVIYNAMIAWILYKDSIAGVYVGPEPEHDAYYRNENNLPAPMQYPINITIQDLSTRSLDIDGYAVGSNSSLYYVMGSKPNSLYNFQDLCYYHGVRLALKLSQSTFLACLLLLNTYWCRHVEALVDEGDFMSKTEMYLYYILSVSSLLLPVSLWLGLYYGLKDIGLAEKVSDTILLVLGVTVLIGYALTCIRLRALERDSRNVNGDDTSTTLQLVYYIHCVYWLIGSLIPILALGILFAINVVDNFIDTHLTLAQAVNDILNSIWATLVVMAYPAAMFLLYPTVDVLTTPENDPGQKFQKRVRRSVKDTKRIRESLFLEGDSVNGADGHHSSLHGLTTYPSPSDGSQLPGSQQQRYSFYEPFRRERMGSITAVVSEMQVIVEEDADVPYEKASTPGTQSTLAESGSDSKGKSLADKLGDRHTNNTQSAGAGAYIRMEESGEGSHNKDFNDMTTMKKWLSQNGEMDRSGTISDLDKAIPPDQHSQWSQIPLNETTDPTHDDLTTLVHSDLDQTVATLSVSNTNGVGTTPKSAPTTPKQSPAPLAGILKIRNSSQNPFDQHTTMALTLANLTTPTFGVRTSSIQGMQRRSNDSTHVKRRASNPNTPKPTVSTPTPPLSGPSMDSSMLSPTSPQRRSNVTGRVDAGALALVALQQQQQQQQTRRSKSRSSKDGFEVDYFGLKRSSSENMTPTTPPPLPYEPQAQGIQPPELNMPSAATGFLMADPYPSMGTRYLDSDSDQEISQSGSSSESQDGRGSTGSSKKYRAPPPPIPTDAKALERRSSGTPGTPSTPTTPPGVRPRRSVDTVVDQQFIEMANRMYKDHVVPAHIVTLTNLPVIAPASTAVVEHSEIPLVTSASPLSPALSQSQQQPSVSQEEQAMSPPQQVMTPPARSPYRVRETFESRVSQSGASLTVPNNQSQSTTTPPSPTSTASPTMASSTTLPRPLTPAWYETKTNFASTNDVLTHYNAVMRGGSHHNRELHQEIQMDGQLSPVQSSHVQPFYHESAIGPLDIVPQPSEVVIQEPQYDERPPETRSQQTRMGSVDSFGVVRSRSSSNRKNDSARVSAIQREHQQGPQVDRQSFMMPSETISTYSTWTGDLSDVTTTSGEVSIGAFVDRKHTASLLQPQSQYDRPRSGEKMNSQSSYGVHYSGDEQEKDNVRKSQASAYSMGSSFGAGSSSRQSGGTYSNYSNSGSIVISGSLALVNQPSSSSASAALPSGSSGSSPSGAVQKHNSGTFKKRSSHNRSGSGSGHASLTGSTGSTGSRTGSGSASSGGIQMGASVPVVGKMNSMRLSAFGPGEDDVDISETGSLHISQGGGLSSGELYLDETNQKTPQDLERQIQQEWMERRAAVKKDSKNRLEQIHRQQQEIDEQNRIVAEQQKQQEQQAQQEQQQQLRDRQLRYLQLQNESRGNNLPSEEPYHLEKEIPSNSLDYSTSETSGAASYPFSRSESAGMSSSSPSGTAVSKDLASSASSMANTIITETPSPSPNAQLYEYSSSSTSRPGPITPTTLSTSYPEQSQQHVDDADDEEPNPLIQSSTSYALHRRRSQQQTQTRRSPPPPPSLLHYDSIDSIATIRARRYQPSPVTSPSSPQPQRSIPPSPQPQRSDPSSPTTPTSPNSLSQRQQYAQYRFPQNQQQFHHPQSDLQSQGASLTVLGPSQYRIVPDDVASERSLGFGGTRGSASPASRAMSPVERSNSRLTNLTNPESEYQWESAELNHHRWEMLENPPRNN